MVLKKNSIIATIIIVTTNMKMYAFINFFIWWVLNGYFLIP
ncbi:hypothetical protein FLJC2902T_17350 [Flavobacterium limnosediminis JC2902]|uniref:Uncharacterized protein n=1 Tax=Flavobacterium limnosediminis JC2902 TaxID=1341181 RepID=V6SQ92_9FLAO|nr:hypothetical protein FLJC2902T_17350 [Flavobacterium limnosediminis JC2902]